MNHPTDDAKTNKVPTETTNRALHDLAGLGVGEVAYVRSVQVDGQTAFAVHGADGRPLAVAADREVAVAITRQNDLEPLSVH